MKKKTIQLVPNAESFVDKTKRLLKKVQFQEDEFTQDRKIDPDYLDAHWVHISDLNYKYGKFRADSEHNVRVVEEAIKLRRSEIMVMIKDDGTASNAQEVEARMRVHRDMKGLKDLLLQCQLVQGRVSAAHYAIQDRKGALEELCRLFVAQYYAGPIKMERLVDRIMRMKRKGGLTERTSGTSGKRVPHR